MQKILLSNQSPTRSLFRAPEKLSPSRLVNPLLQRLLPTVLPAESCKSSSTHLIIVLALTVLSGIPDRYHPSLLSIRPSKNPQPTHTWDPIFRPSPRPITLTATPAAEPTEQLGYVLSLSFSDHTLLLTSNVLPSRQIYIRTDGKPGQGEGGEGDGLCRLG